MGGERKEKGQGIHCLGRLLGVRREFCLGREGMVNGAWNGLWLTKASFLIRFSKDQFHGLDADLNYDSAFYSGATQRLT